ncbi:MAG: hypothetical protein U0694_05710 [Anaerolineae bacterium]
MSAAPKLTLQDLLLSLRQSVLDAIEHNDKNKLQDLKITFGRLVEEAYASHDDAVIAILVALEDAARDALTGVSWKSDIPSVESVEKAIKS